MAFADPDIVFEGWYWTAPSRDVKRGRVLAVDMMGRKLVLYRGGDGAARCVDAYCPHMGAHLALGRVEGDGLRCFFHGWRFDGAGACAEIPALGGAARPDVRIARHHVEERDGLIWLWVGDRAPAYEPPVHLELRGEPRRSQIVARWRKNCHPNVVLINAIDEQHFRTVHRVPGEALRLETTSVTPAHFRASNTGAPPKHTWLWRVLAFFYRETKLVYDIDYYSGTTGCVRLGPDWARLYLMFAVRPDAHGKAEGVTIALTRGGRGWLGAVRAWFMLRIAAVAGAYFSVGDTKVFNSIRFDLQSPIPADRTVRAYVRHVERQPQAHGWRQAPLRAGVAAE